MHLILPTIMQGPAHALCFRGQHIAPLDGGGASAGSLPSSFTQQSLPWTHSWVQAACLYPPDFCPTSGYSNLGHSQSHQAHRARPPPEARQRTQRQGCQSDPQLSPRKRKAQDTPGTPRAQDTSRWAAGGEQGSDSRGACSDASTTPGHGNLSSRAGSVEESHR